MASQPAIVNLYTPADVRLLDTFAAELNINRIAAQAMVNRGIGDLTAARYYVNASSSKLGQWDGNEQVEKAAMRIMNAIYNRETIVIYGDFDADGVTSTRIAILILTALGADVEPYIPSRIDEGYGLNTQAIDTLRQKKGAKLVITVDCGIRSIIEAEYCNTVKTHLIITDHHNLGNEIPNAYAVINPKDTRYPYTDSMLAGAGVSFRFFEYVYHYMVKKAPLSIKPKVSWDSIRRVVTQLVMIGTVADLVPMKELYNRILVKEGLKMYAEDPLIGIKAIAESSGITGRPLQSMDIGYSIGPRVNAAGRLESAMTAYDILASNDKLDADLRADRLNILNGQRQELTIRALEQALEILANDQDRSSMCNFINAEIKGGILGLVAGKLSQQTFRPSIVMTGDGHTAHGSARSIPGVNITEALESCSDLLLSFGGHDQAAGLNILESNIPEFRRRLQLKLEEMIDVSTMVPSFDVDAKIDINDVNDNLYRSLQVLEPVGNTNSSAQFLSESVSILEQKVIGREKNHYKIVCSTAKGPVDGIFFGGVAKVDKIDGKVNLIYEVDENTYDNKTKIQIKIKDIATYYIQNQR